MDMQIVFPGGKRVQSVYKGFTVETDQPVNEGGEGTAPEPLDLFLSAIGTCAGVNVLYFCEARKISMDGIKMDLIVERNEKTHLMEKIVIRLDLPDDFPIKYKKAVMKVVEMCAVKRNIFKPPDIQVHVV